MDNNLADIVIEISADYIISFLKIHGRSGKYK